MYEKYYSLKDRPFTIVPNPGCLYMSAKHKLAFAHLQYGLMEGTGIVVLTGGIGTGKTTLLRFLLGKIERVMDVAVVFNTNVTGAELLRLIIREFEAGEPGEDKAANLAMLNDYLIERFRLGMQAVVIIDEAQNLSREALEEVRLLSNLQASTRPLLQVILAGQPELRSKLADPALTQLAQRVTSTFHLSALDEDETGRYIRFRLTQSGGNPDLFDPEAIEAVHQASGGVPRVINIICNSALVHGFADELPVITAGVVAEVVADMGPTLPAPGAGDSAPCREDRVAALEERLGRLEETLADRRAEIQLLSMELRLVNERLASLSDGPQAARATAPAPAPATPEPLPENGPDGPTETPAAQAPVAPGDDRPAETPEPPAAPEAEQPAQELPAAPEDEQPAVTSPQTAPEPLLETGTPAPSAATTTGPAPETEPVQPGRTPGNPPATPPTQDPVQPARTSRGFLGWLTGRRG